MKKIVKFKPGDIVKIINQELYPYYGHKAEVHEMQITDGEDIWVYCKGFDYSFSLDDLELVEENQNTKIERDDRVGYFTDGGWENGLIEELIEGSKAYIQFFPVRHYRSAKIKVDERLCPLDELILLEKTN